ncbi:DUF3794 domain-containing protein [Clostridium perfringens]|nr:DUF3794 domain-containing protein [Clostridium perfringens]
MTCNNQNNTSNRCGCEFNLKTVGVANVANINIDGSNRKALNWTEISVPEILTVPALKPDIESVDQVYANIQLNSTKLIETPFAYERYVLFSFFNSANALVGVLPGLVTALSGTITALLAPITGALTTAINAAITAINALPIPLPGDDAILAILQGTLDSINILVNGINDALTDVTNAVASLLAAIAAVPFLPDVICAAIQALTSALNALVTLVNTVPALITTILNALSAAVGSVSPAIALLINAIIAILETGPLSPTAIAALVSAVVDAVTGILDELLSVDCDEAYAFEIKENAEGTCLSGRKLVIEGVLKQKVVYTAEVTTQSVHSANYEVPFSAFIIPYASFEGLTYQEGIEVYDPTNPTVPKVINGFISGTTEEIIPNLCEEFNIDTYIEDIFIYAMDPRTIFKNVTVFLRARVATACN